MLILWNIAHSLKGGSGRDKLEIHLESNNFSNRLTRKVKSKRA